MLVYEALAKEFQIQGITKIFGLMGEDLAKFVVEIDRLGLDYVACRHENQAVAMADGYARFSGQLGVALVTSGPGFTNALTLITTAARACSRVLVLVGASSALEDESGMEHLRSIKYFRYAEACAFDDVPFYKPRTAEAVLGEAQAAIERARRDTTVVLNLAADILEEPATVQPHAKTADAPQLPLLEPPSDEITVVADLLQETWAAGNILILAGRGAVLSNAGPAIRRLGEITGAALSTSLPATPYFDGDPYYLGVCGTFSTSLGAEIIGHADTVLCFGASLNFFQTFGNSLFPKARVIQVDIDRSAFGRYLPVEPELSLHADARLTAEALVGALEKRGHSRVGLRTEALASSIREFDPRKDFQDESSVEGIDPRTAMLALDRMLPKDRTVVIDPSHQATFTAACLRVPQPERFALPVEAGSIGVALGEGIGAAFAIPEALSIVGIGDAGLLMSLSEIETAVRYHVPIVVIVSNDRALGSEVHFLDVAGLPATVAKHSTPSFALVAAALGAEGHTVMSPADLRTLEERFTRPVEGPIVIECVVNPTVRGAWMAALHGASRPSVASPA